MAENGKLTALKVAKLTKVGVYRASDGLYLQVRGPTMRSWLLRFQLKGKQRAMGLGSLDTLSLAQARDEASRWRTVLREGKDPIEVRKAERARQEIDAARSMTFRQCADAYIEAHKAGWRNAKHADQWGSTLKTYVYPTFGDLPVAAVDTGLVLKVLQPIWKTKTETASRVRGRVEATLNWAKSRGYRSGENPAAWRGHLENLLPKRSKVARVKHHAALPYSEMGEFMVKLRAQEAPAARALEFTILTAARTGETIGATWGEFDLDAKTWTVPASRTKTGKEHRVALSPAAAAVVQKMAKIKTNDFVFAGARLGKPISNMTMLVLLKRMGRPDLTAHGFRSTFRDWAAEQTAFPSEVVEMALAHAVGNKVEAAYRRGDLFDKRRKLMDAWADFCAAAKPAKQAGKVVPMRAGSA